VVVTKRRHIEAGGKRRLSNLVPHRNRKLRSCSGATALPVRQERAMQRMILKKKDRANSGWK
jgi:hypothetical protein